MKCPLILNSAGSLGTVNYLVPCECIKLCALTACKYRKNGFLVQVGSMSATTTDTVCIQSSACGGSMPLAAASNGALVTVADLTVGTAYRIYPDNVGGILRGIVEGI
jgi:hypothetical protein